MTLIRTNKPRGMRPKAAPRQLGAEESQKVQNARLWAGDIIPVKKSTIAGAPAKGGTIQTIFPLNGALSWLHWPQDVDVIRTPVDDDDSERIHYSGHYNPKSTDLALATTGGTDYPVSSYRLGVPRPDTAPTVGETGGSGATETRAYVYCFVPVWDEGDTERGPPSAATSFTGYANSTSFDLSGMDAAPPNTFTVTNIVTNATTVSLTIANHMMETGEYMVIAGFQDMTELNGTWAVTRVDANTVTIPVTTTKTWERIVDGDMSVPASWDLANWIFSGGKVQAVTPGTGGVRQSLARDLVVNVYYTLTYDVGAGTIGDMAVLVTNSLWAGIATIESFVPYTASGQRTKEFAVAPTAQKTDHNIAFTRLLSGTYDGTIDNVSVTESLTSNPITFTREAPIQTTNMEKWIYRTKADGNYYFVDTVPAAQLTYTDTKTDAQLGTEALPVEAEDEWIAPPGDLAGLILHPDGYAVGFSGKEICFSEPYIPYAFPLKNRYRVDYDIVGLGIWGGYVIILTKGLPYTAIATTSPSDVSKDRLDFAQACVSKQGIVSLREGVVYPSPDGLVFIGAGGPRLMTEAVVEKQEWGLYNPPSIMGAIYDNRYYGFFAGGGEAGDEKGGFVIDPGEANAFFTEVSPYPTAVYSDLETDTLYMMDAPYIVAYDNSPEDEQAYFQSKVFVANRPTTLTVAKIRFTATANITDAEKQQAISDAWDVLDAAIRVPTGLRSEQGITSGTFGGYMPGQYTVAGGPYLEAASSFGDSSGLLFKFHAGGELKHTETVANESPFRMRDDYNSDECWYEISGHQVKIHEVLIADSVAELAKA